MTSASATTAPVKLAGATILGYCVGCDGRMLTVLSDGRCFAWPHPEPIA